MHHPPHPCYPPDREPFPEESDAVLAASLRAPSWSVDPRPLGVLMQRHWEPVLDYAMLCTDLTGGHPAALAAAALHQVLRGLGRPGPAVALRPRLLMTVRSTAEAWALDGQRSHRAAEPGAAQPGLGVARDRGLALISFDALPPAGQCLLWHTAVEAEPVSVPAALLALDTGSALTELELARGQFRSGMLLTHAERAEQPLCRLYNRLLDAQIRRGRTLLPDVRQHLLGCPDCAAAAEQLGIFERRLGELLAQAVLGRPAADYLASRTGRPRSVSAEPDPADPSPPPGGHRRPGRHRVAAGSPAPAREPAPPRGYTRALLTGVGLASALALGAAVTSTLWPAGSATRAGSPAQGGAVPRPGSGGGGGARPAAPPRAPAAKEPPGSAASLPVEAALRDTPAPGPRLSPGSSCDDTAGPRRDEVTWDGPVPRWMRDRWVRDLIDSPAVAAGDPAASPAAGGKRPGAGGPAGTGEEPPGARRPPPSGDRAPGADLPDGAAAAVPGARPGAGALPPAHPRTPGGSGKADAVRPGPG
ncbi:hydrolase [Streptomyces sp. TS71-3]|uniref:hydrolase n=1 Tax=Streptomyces sp. TS71-3 TaxID=2733862 RepID=UPI001B2C251E|nr:hydrolase [Streptomyces sp. TS71-3]GHJ42491.1 hypothetical protein Sm713_81000 [Streptomyces sp. TS71-3]